MAAKVYAMAGKNYAMAGKFGAMAARVYAMAREESKPWREKRCRRGQRTLIKALKGHILRNMEKPRIYTASFSSVYPLYIQKAEKKGRTKGDVDAIIFWLTGYNQQTLQEQIDRNIDIETFFAQAPRINPGASKITGKICGYRVEEIEDKLMQKIRYLDKLVDELSKGKAMETILRN
jgi:hypothetical protein